MRPKEPKKHTVVRCPKGLFDDIERICRQHRLTRTRLVNMALFAFAARLDRDGGTPACPRHELPPPPKPRDYYL